MRPVLTLPGIQNSGPDHWQSRWEAQHPGVTRVQQRDWDHPARGEWVEALEAAVRAQPEPPILVAHSLGCLAVAHWAAGSDAAIHAALLVALPDPKGASFPPEATGFDPVPVSLGGRRVRLVASADDPYASLAHSRRCAQAWRAELVELGTLGHLNAASGLGDWPQAWAWVAGWRAEA